MEIVNILIVVSAVIIILILWAIVGLRHLKHLRREIHDQWEILDESLRKRHNLLPNLIETIRKFSPGQENLLQQMIQERIKAVKEYYPGAAKIEYEHDLSQTINKIIDLGRSNQELSKDTNFLELRKEIDDLEKNIVEKTNKYNEMTRYYNRHRKILLLKPISAVFGFKMENIFEVEV